MTDARDDPARTPTLAEFRRELDRDPPYREFVARTLVGRPCAIALYVNQLPADHVRMYRVVQLKPGLYRAVVLYKTLQPPGVLLEGADDARDQVAAWLRLRGVPVLRIGAPLY